VTSGPFKDWKLHLGPVSTIWPNIPPNPQADGLGYNPRCLSRELSPQAAMNATDGDIVSLINNSQDIKTFQDVMQYVVADDLGLHGAGHYMIAGDANGDLYNSPADPAFFMHHSMIDLVWWVWQTLDLKERHNAIAGTITFMNLEPSRNATLDDLLDLGYAGSSQIPIRKAMSTTGVAFCYVYA
jgi:tyrosinase